jgi:ketosteroid isomerase-like protein
MNRTLGALFVGLLLAACQPPADPRVAAIADRIAIDQLVAGDYPRALDAHDWDAYVATYTEDGVMSLAGQEAKGRAGIKTFLAALPPDDINHVISNLSYEISGDKATGGAYWEDIGLVDGKPGVIVAGHYEDTLRKVGGEWKFASRSIVIDFAAPAAPPSGAASQ